MTTNNQKNEFKIRFAGEDDVPVILSLIRELAIYEKLEHEVVATEEGLRDTLFGSRNIAQVIIGELKDEPVAFALFFYNYSTFLGKPGIYLEDLFVKSPYRNQGFGKSLFAYLGHFAASNGCGRLEWSVLDWNSPAIEFYKSMGAIPMEDWTTHRLTGSSLSHLADEYKNRQS